MPDIVQYLSSIGVLELTGVGGFLCYLLSFGAVQFGFLDGNAAFYSLANVIAATMVAISLISEFNLSSALIQGSWIMIGVIGLGLRAQKALSAPGSDPSSLDTQEF